MMKLFLVIYSASGSIGGVVGPIPRWDNCAIYAREASEKMHTHPELEQLTFKCEWHDSRPRLAGD